MRAGIDVVSGPVAAETAVFGRIRRNLGWLIGGRGFQAVASLFYLGLAARALGAENFGEFTLVLAYGQGIANLAQFQSWQAVVRYGAVHRARVDKRRLQRLFGFTATLDGAAAVFGGVTAAAGVVLLGPWFGWSPEQEGEAVLLAVTLLLSLGATPLGILRLHDRFDLVTFALGLGPLIRLSGAALGWAAGFGVEGFLVVWASAALVQGGMLWTIVLVQSEWRPAFGRRRWILARRENPGVLRFMAITNVASGLTSLPDQLGTLAIGGTAGPAAAGGYRLAAKLAKGMSRPVQLLVAVIFPELARLLAEKDHATLDRVMERANRVVAILALCFVMLFALTGSTLLRLLSGISYPDAGMLLSLFAVAAAIDLSGFALEPLLTAHGRAGRVLAIRAWSAGIYLFLLAVLVPVLGPVGAVLAGVGSSAFARFLLGRAVHAVTPG